MPTTITIKREIWKKNEDGSETLIEVQELEGQEPTQEEIIADKEAELLAMYKELEAIKSVNSES